MIYKLCALSNISYIKRLLKNNCYSAMFVTYLLMMSCMFHEFLETISYALLLEKMAQFGHMYEVLFALASILEDVNLIGSPHL